MVAARRIWLAGAAGIREHARMHLQPAPASPPPWTPGAVHLWWLDGPLRPPPSTRRARLDGVLRRVLAPYVGLAPEALRFGREARGRPFLLADDAPDFNLSDTGGGTLVAVAQRGRVGIDLERLDRTLSHRELAVRYFAEREIAALQALDDEAARQAFLRLWTAKESSCKATGTGIFGWLPRWSFDPAPDAPQLWNLPPEAGDRADWHHLRLQPHPQFTAVLSCQGFAPTALGFQLPPCSGS